MIKEICKNLGVSIGEVWRANNDSFYTINENGDLFEVSTSIGLQRIYNEEYRNILNNTLWPIWKPESSGSYYLPDLLHGYIKAVWNNSEVDKLRYEMGIVFKTKEEAIGFTRKSIEIIMKSMRGE